MSVSEERAERALRYLAETDEEFSRRESYFSGLERMRHPVKSEVFIRSTGTVAERESLAYDSTEYREHIGKIDKAEKDFLEMKYKRETERLVWDHWRSLNANRRVGA